MTKPQEIIALDRPAFAWVRDPSVRKIVAALEAKTPGSARFVGGCVRDSLVGVAPKDIDIATPLTPHEVTDALHGAGLSAAPTGIEHGTITAIADHKGVEVTSLRADVSTDGRRATVAFTDDWETDARRRDFTINAMYLSPEGALFDPTGGKEDLKAGRVRFIGDAEMRIREDYLRILRFFRFSARFARNGFDQIGLAACEKLRGGIATLSGERIGAEFLALLNLPAPDDALRAMATSGVFAQIFDQRPALEIAQRMKRLAPDAAAPLMLAGLFGETTGLKSLLRLSNDQDMRRKLALKNASAANSVRNERDARALLYRLGEEAYHDALLLAGAHAGAEKIDFLDLASVWTPPKFPLSGRDILVRNVPNGPLVAELLKAVEDRWIEEDYPPRARVLDFLDAEITRRTK